MKTFPRIRTAATYSRIPGCLQVFSCSSDTWRSMECLEHKFVPGFGSKCWKPIAWSHKDGLLVVMCCTKKVGLRCRLCPVVHQRATKQEGRHTASGHSRGVPRPVPMPTNYSSPLAKDCGCIPAQQKGRNQSCQSCNCRQAPHDNKASKEASWTKASMLCWHLGLGAPRSFAFAQGKVCNHPELLEPRGAVTLQQAGSACDCS